MSLLDDARKLRDEQAGTWTEDGRGWMAACRFCDAYSEVSEESLVHAPECPVLALPRIVAALEAAELMTIACDEERVISGKLGGRRLVAALDDLNEALDA